MPFFRIVLHGDGILISDRSAVGLQHADDRTAPIQGFYTTRVIYASNEENAISKAKDLVSMEWKRVHYAQANFGQAPILTVESVQMESFFQSRKPPRKGYTFYSSSNNDM